MGIYCHIVRFHIYLFNVRETGPFTEVFTTPNIHLVNLMYSLGKTWLKSYVQLPHAYTYERDKEPEFHAK